MVVVIGTSGERGLWPFLVYLNETKPLTPKKVQITYDLLPEIFCFLLMDLLAGKGLPAEL